MKKTEAVRLIEEANNLIEQSDLISEEKENLRQNIEHFMSLLSDDRFVAGCKWEWFDEEEDGHGLDLKWEWKNVNGVFGFYADNGHSFGFEFGVNGSSSWFGGEDGEFGFSCELFVRDFENELIHMGY